MEQTRITRSALDGLPLQQIDSVTFYKRDEIAADLICCEVVVGGRTFFFHEEAEGWDLLLRHVEQLPGFRRDWYGAVVKPSFEPRETLAYCRGRSNDASV
jgi:hypothetical protein